MKLSLKDEVEIIRLYFDGYMGPTAIARKFNVSRTKIHIIIDGYKKSGYDYLKNSHHNNEYSAELKEEIIKQVYQGKSKKSLAAEYGIPGGAGTIISWMHKFEKLGYNGLVKKRGRPNMNETVSKDKAIVEEKDLSLPLTDAERLEFEELKKRYKTLQKDKEITDMENEFLKKLDALVQERLKREKKK